MYDTINLPRPIFPSRPAKNRFRQHFSCLLSVLLAMLVSGSEALSSRAVAQQAAAAAPQAGAQTQYINATEVISGTAAGLIRIPDLPDFCDALEETHAGKLREEELVKPFFDAQRERLRNYLESVNNKIGVKPEDLYDIASGEVVFAWLPFPNEKRRPYSLCLVADIRDRKPKAVKALDQVDQDLKAGGWQRSDVTHRGETVRVYNAKRKPGQITVEQLAICLSDQRVITADRDSVVTDILDALAGKPNGKSIGQQSDFKAIINRAKEAIAGPMGTQGGTVAAQWFAKPFGMGRIVREALDVDRGNDIDIIKLLENQGFAAVTSAGGVVAINGKEYDLLHKGVIRAERPFKMAARILQFDAEPRQPIPAWVSPDTASFNRLNIKIEEAFWAAGTLVDEALGDEIFDEMIKGIHEDKEGPQIDIRNNVLPSLDNEIILIADNVLPADVRSERMLVAIRLNDVDKLKRAIQKWGEVEPDASKMDVPALNGIDIWQVIQGQGGVDEDFDEDLFGEFDDFEEEEEEAKPLLDQWAIGVVPKGPGSTADYLMFSSHPELLIATAKRIQQGVKSGLADVPEVKRVVQSLRDLGVDKPIFDRVVRTKLSMRVKYELLRQGKLRDSDSVLAKLVQRIAEEEDQGNEPDPLNAQKLPPIAQIEQYLPDGGSYLEETKDGWETTGFLLK